MKKLCDLGAEVYRAVIAEIEFVGYLQGGAGGGREVGDGEGDAVAVELEGEGFQRFEFAGGGAVKQQHRFVADAAAEIGDAREQAFPAGKAGAHLESKEDKRESSQRAGGSRHYKIGDTRRNSLRW